jgi:translation initiation factor IF-2
MRQLGGQRPGGPTSGGQGPQGGERRPQRSGQGSTGNIRVAQPPPGRQPARPTQPSEQKKPAQQGGIRKLGDITPEMLAAFSGRETPPSPKELEEVRVRQEREARGPARPGAAPAPAPAEDEEDDDKKGARHRAGAVPGRSDRHKDRAERAKTRKTGGDETRGGGKKLTLDMDERERHRKDRRGHKVKQPGTVARKGKIPISLPITVRSLSEALGRKSGDVLFKLLAQGAPPSININSNIDAEMAELVAIEYGAELEIKRAVDLEQEVIDRQVVDQPEDLEPRAPIVVVMGHVDHGKTSLLDRIREQYGIRSDVVSTEAGGITQVIRAWRVEKDGNPITFLDTPGHEAFTKMRARGANVTDIAVIVVAANDGVMPQTEEAISHARAAGVDMVVAINKVDLPDANLAKVERELYSLELLPDTMGGNVPFVQTSAKTGKGIDELLEQISLVAELAELKANPNKPATGTCLEAYLSEKEGVQATLLVQEGTLHTGDVVLCGASYGSVRRMYDDLGRTIDSAGPSVPVRITGLDEVPNADDPFVVVPDLSTAREIAEERKARAQEKALTPRRALDLTTLKEAQIAELKVILKAEARGSIEAIRNELEKLQHEEVRVRVLHTGIGAINVSDVTLALTSPEDTLLVGFNVVPDNDAKALAEERGIPIKEYKIIYQLADDIRAALEGKLKPREEVVHLGRAVVRETFKISRVGTIAGCSVTQGVIERNAKVRVIRQGVVVYPPAEKSVGLESLKRFKEDVREVRSGFECGLKIAGYDDVKVDDVIEAYRVEQVQRTLS